VSVECAGFPELESHSQQEHRFIVEVDYDLLKGSNWN
jgi:hypothetical protein